EDLTAHVDGDLFRQIAVGDGDGHIGDIAHLSGQIAGHQVDVVSEIFPGAGDSGHRGLTAELAFGADLAGDPGDCGRGGDELMDHGVDGFLQLKNLAAHIDSYFFRQVAVGDGDGDIGDVADLGGQIARHDVDAFGEILPNAADVTHLRLAAELSFGADLAGDPGDFGSETPELIDHGVDRIFEPESLAADIDSDFFRQIAVGDGDGDIGNIAHLVGQVAGHEVDAIGKILPGAGDAGDRGLTAEFPFGADLPRNPGDFGSKTAQLIDHGVD